MSGLWVGIGTAAAGALSANQANKASKRASKNAGKVDVTTTNAPWEPSEEYRKWAMDGAANVMGFGTPDPRFGAPNPKYGVGAGQSGPAGGGGKKGKGKAKGKGGGGGAASGFAGMSQETDRIRNAMINRAQEGNSLYGEGEGFISDLLAGEDNNSYRGEAADYVRDVTSDEDLRRYKDLLFESFEGARGGRQPGNQGGNVTYRSYSATAGPGGTPASSYEAGGPTGAAAVLKGIMAGDDVPGAAAMRERIKRESDAAYADRAKDLRARAVGGGMYGGTPYQGAETAALTDYDQRLKDAFAAQDYQMYGQALGLGTQYDIASLDRAAQERMSGNASSAASGAAANQLALQREMAYMGALGDAIGMGTDLSKFQASGMGSLADMYSGDQRFALGALPDVTGLGLRDWGAAGDLSLGSDQTRTGFANAQAQARVGMAGVGLGRQQLAFDRERYYDPLSRMGSFIDILNGASGGYGTQAQQGIDGRAQSPAVQVSPWGQAIAGGIAGYSMGRSFQNQGGG